MIELPYQISDTVILKPNEEPIYFWRTQFTFKSNENKMGYVIATNMRLIFLEAKGIISRKYNLIDTINYSNIIGFSVNGVVFKSLQINTTIGDKNQNPIVTFWDLDKDTFKEKGKIPYEEAREKINKLVQQRLESIEEEKRQSRIQYVMDFSFLKAEMEKGGITLTTVKCPSCGANVYLPSDGNNFACEYCNNTIHAHDIFQKMKGLIQNL